MGSAPRGGSSLKESQPSPLNLQKGSSTMVALGFIVFLCLATIYLLYGFFGKVVAPGEIGVRRNFFAVPGILTEGFQENGLPPGLHWQIPEFSVVMTLPRGLQTVDLNRREDSSALGLGPLDVQTADGSKVRTDVSFILRYFESPGETSGPQDEKSSSKLDDGEDVPFAVSNSFNHGGPRDLINFYKEDIAEQLGSYAVQARDHLREQLTKLSTIDYYNPRLRENAALRANEEANERLGQYGVGLWATLVRRYTYLEQSIDDQIFKKNLQEQTEYLNAAKSELAEVRAETEQQRALWDAKIRDLEVEGDSQVQVIRSEAELYEDTKKAEGDLLVDKAVAEVDKAKAQALTKIEGADVYIAREMAPLLRTLSGGVVTDLDPYDMNQWLKKLLPELKEASE